MKILMLAPQPFLQPRGTPLTVLARLVVLSRLGHSVDLVTYPSGEEVQLPGLTLHRIARFPGFDRVGVGPSMAKLVLDALLFARAGKLFLRNSYDLLLCVEEASWFGAAAARVTGVPHVYDMHSSLPEQFTGYGYASPLVAAVSRALERFTIRSSDVVIPFSPSLSNHVQRIRPNVPTVVIEDAAPLADSGDPRALALARKALHGRRLVIYTGTAEAYQGLDILVDAAAKVISRMHDVGFLLVGGKRAQTLALQECVRSRGLDAAFHFAGTRPPDEIPAFLEAGDVLVSPRRGGMNTPLKLYDYMRSGRPIVATNVEAHTQVVGAEAAHLVDPNPGALAAGILRVLGDPALAVQLGGAARRAFEKRCNGNVALERTARALRTACFGRAA